MALKLAPGEIVAGRYRLDRLLGEGGMGSVWAAVHTITRRVVALKFIRRLHDAKPEMRRRFLREARAASAVDHPNVVGILDVFELEDTTPVMVIDFLEGESLREKLAREGAQPMASTASLLLPVVSAVGTAHALGIVHRDLKPDNVFVARDRSGGTVVKVLDFGIAKLADGAADGPASATTGAGALLGTPHYMAPEQAFGEHDEDHRSDIWALGVVAYECLSGVRPIEGDNVGQTLKHLLSSAITPIEHMAPDVPADVALLVGRMLSREKSLRPDDLREVAAVLAQYTDVSAPAFGPAGSGARERPAEDESARPSLAPSGAPPRTSTPRWAVALGVAVTASGLLFAFAPSGAPSAAPPGGASTPTVAPPALTAATAQDVAASASSIGALVDGPPRSASASRPRPTASPQSAGPAALLSAVTAPAGSVAAPRSTRGLIDHAPF